MAQHMTGIMYVKGQGTKEDPVQAYKWFTLATKSLPSAKGSSSYQAMAAKARDAVEAKLTKDQVAQAQKLVEEWQKVDEMPPGKAANLQ
jgi:TPR repeat protein